MKSIFIGFDPREAHAFAVARRSIEYRTHSAITVRGLILDVLRREGLYTRDVERRDGRLWDPISEAPMSTEFAISRFLTPIVAMDGWALFVDCDVMARRSIAGLFRLADPKYAVMCVKHRHEPSEGEKMDGQAQLRYARKNWSSVMLFNVEHPANKVLTVDVINSVPGRDLHRFFWLDDDLIGELPVEWNWLVGHSDPDVDPAIVHFTDGIPTMPGYESVPYANEWREEMERWAA